MVHAKFGTMGAKVFAAAFGWAIAAAGDYSVPAASLAIAAMALVYSILSLKRQSKNDLTTQLYAQIQDLERQLSRVEGLLDEAQSELTRVREENIQLMRKLLAETRRD